MGKKIGAFLVGGLVGAAAALLYAPRSGQETRVLVSEKMNAAWGQAQEFGAQAQARGQEVVQGATAKGQEVAQGVAAKSQELYGAAASRVQEAAGNIKPTFTEKNDDLREKIEAARQRIAAQVAKNAEVAQDAASDEIPVAVEAAEEVTEAVKETADGAAAEEKE